MDEPHDAMLTTVELARRLHVGPNKVRDLARSGQIPSLRVEGLGFRFNWIEVVAALRFDHAGAAKAQDGAS